jgi:hypothetical protein
MWYVFLHSLSSFIFSLRSPAAQVEGYEGPYIPLSVLLSETIRTNEWSFRQMRILIGVVVAVIITIIIVSIVKTTKSTA